MAREQRRGHHYIADENLIPINRVVEAINLIKRSRGLNSIAQVARLVGQHERVIYRLQKHKVLPRNLAYLDRWVELSGQPAKYLTGEWK